MRSSDIGILSIEGLAEREMSIKVQIDDTLPFEKLSKTTEGKFLIEHLRARLASIKELYYSIPPAHPSAPHILAGFQGAQNEVQDIMDIVCSSNKQLLKLNSELKEIDNEIKRRTDAIRNSESESLLPSSMSKRRKKQ